MRASEGRGETDDGGWVVRVGMGRSNENGIYIYEKVREHI